MSLQKQSKATAGLLPKSVKVRSTCNACQQAKIRCSHEKPSCRRCQKHRIDCIYSVSRRLGRPAKKKESRPELEEQSKSSAAEIAGDQEREKKARKSTKRKSHGKGSMAGVRARTGKTSGKATVEVRAQASIVTDDNGEDISGQETDLAAENWIQELMSTRLSWETANTALVDLYNEAEPECSLHPNPSLLHQATDIYPSSISEEPEPSPAQTSMEIDSLGFPHLVLDNQLEPPALQESDVLPWSYGSGSGLEMHPLPSPWPMERVSPMNVVLNPTGDCTGFQSPVCSHESEEYSPDHTDLRSALDEESTFGCSCYRQAMSELVRSGTKTGSNGRLSIDSILACQKELLLQAETILLCKMCSQSEAQANMLMVMIVTIDSLLTTLDVTATSAKAGVQDVVSPTGAQLAERRQKNIGGGFKFHIDSCPLLVGGFQVPLEEKACFIRQVLQARLSMLLLTIRRIRVCMQQHLTSAFSRGRLLMIMDTDRRLQLIMMKIKLALG